MTTIGIDIDGVLADSVGHLIDTDKRFSNLKVDDIKTYSHMHKHMHLGEALFHAQYKDDFVLKTPPLPGAIRMAWEVAGLGHDICYITSRPIASAPATETWLEDYGFPLGPVHLVDADDKADIGFIDVLIEDRGATAIVFSQTQRLAVLIPQPWNQYVRPNDHLLIVEKFSDVARVIRDHIAGETDWGEKWDELPPHYPVPELTGLNYDNGKSRVDLIPGQAIKQIGDVMAAGCQKYDVDNWRGGTEWRKQYGSLLRHCLAWIDGEDKDPETGCHHMAHVAARAIFLLEFAECDLGTDDRWMP